MGAGDRPGQGAGAGRRWDVALSFAGAQREYVGQVAAALKARGVRCFYDEDEQVRLWGAHLAEELPRIYAQESAAVVVFISAEYAGQPWTRLERRAALARAVAEAGVYVLPARFDDSDLPGLLPDVVTVDLRRYTPAQFADLVANKLAALTYSPTPWAGAGRPVWDAGAARPARAVQELLDFDVAIEPVGDGGRVRVVASPAGEAQAGFALPFTDKDLEILILKVVGSIGRVRRKVRRIQSEERRLLEDFGGQLFQAVFSGPIRECLGRSRLIAESRDTGLRIRLRLSGALANIPWEYLYDAEYGFLGLSPETVLARHLEMPAPVRPFPISPPLRILTMISAPSDIPELEGEEEWDKLDDALADLIRSGMVQVDRLEAGTLTALQRPLRLRDYHVLHFIGHGVYDEDAQDGALALEGTGRKTRLVTGRDLGLMIRGHRSLRLVVLNACEGARSARDDPLGGVAQALVRQGIPAVIAMQFEISDPAALVFSQSFYQAIADGLPVDMAMVEARRAMFADGNEVEWATPVLYLRSPDGRVFTEVGLQKPVGGPEEASGGPGGNLGRA